MAATLRVPTIFTAVDKVSNVVKRMGKNTMSAMNKIETGVGRANRLFNRLTPSIGNAGKEILTYVSAATIAAAAFSGVSFGINSIMDYETAMQSLSAVTGETSAKFETQIESIAKRSKKSAIDVAGSFEVIGSAMSQYLDNPKALGQIAEAGITLAKASRQELEPSLENLTSIMNQFDLGADKAVDTINRLTAGEIVGQVTTANMSKALQQFGAVANANNVTLDESVALVEVLGKKLPTEQLGTASRNLITFMNTAKAMPKPAIIALKKHGVNLNLLMDKHASLGEKLKELQKIQKDGIAMEAFFGRENIAAGTIILGNLPTYEKWQKTILKTNEAQTQAAKNSNTLKNRITEVKNSIINWTVSGDKLNPTLEKIKDHLVWLADNIDLVATWTFRLIAAFVIMKATLLAASITMAAYNIALGVFAALNTSSAISVGTNTIALRAWYITTLISEKAMWLWAGVMKVVTAAQWLWNAAMTANPIGIIIVGIGALIALVAAIIVYWDEWGATVVKFMGPLGMVIDFIMTLRQNWDMVVKAFKSGGIIGGLKAIGRVLLDVLLKPVQMLLGALSKIPGLSKLAQAGFANVTAMRAGLGVESSDPKERAAAEKNALVSPTVKQGQATTESIMTTRNQLDVNLNDPTGKATVKKRGPLNIPIKVTPTNGRK